MKEFIGRKYTSDTEKEAILNGYNEFQKRKLIFLRENYSKKWATMDAYFKLLDNHVNPYEVLFDKDVMNFDIEELELIFNSRVSYSQRTRESLVALLRSYFQWSISRGEIMFNQMEGLNIDKITEGNKSLVEKKLCNLAYIKDLYRFCQNVGVNINIMLPILLARYGIVGDKYKYMLNLKWRDIDLYNNVANITDEETGEIIVIDTDDLFSKILKEIKDNNDLEGIETDYVVSTKKGEQLTQSGLLNRITMIKKRVKDEKSNLKVYSVNDLLNSRLFELLLKIREERKVSMYDLDSLNEIYKMGKSDGAVEKIRRVYEKLTNEEIVTRPNSNSRELKDSHSKKFSNLIATKYNIDLSNIPKLKA